MSRLPFGLMSLLLYFASCENKEITLTSEECILATNSPCSSADKHLPDLSSIPSLESNKFDVIVVMGQSNTLVGPGYDSTIDKGHARIFQLGRFDENNLKVIHASEPLEHHERIDNNIGFALTFCKWYVKEFLATDRNVLIIPCGQGGSGLGDRRWNKGDDLYSDAVARISHVLTTYSGSDLKAILWHQGEDDVDFPDFQQALDSMITNFRRDIPTKYTSPFILGGMVPFWVDQSEARLRQECIIKTTPSRLPHSYFADPRSPCVISKTENTIDDIHYDANGQRLLGFRYFNAYKEAQ